MKLFFSLAVLSLLFCKGYSFNFLSSLKQKVLPSSSHVSLQSNDNGETGNMNKYCASFKSSEDNGISGFFTLITRAESQRFMYDIDITNLASSCDFSHGVAYSINSYWKVNINEDGKVVGSALGDQCSASNVGGHYDPGLACSTYSQNYLDGNCGAIDRVKPDYEYSCSAESIKSGNLIWCEAGDLSSKHGVIYPIPVSYEEEDETSKGPDNERPDEGDQVPDNNNESKEGDKDSIEEDSGNEDQVDEYRNAQEGQVSNEIAAQEIILSSQTDTQKVNTRIYLKSPESYKDWQPFPRSDHYQIANSVNAESNLGWSSVVFTCVSDNTPLFCGSLDTYDLDECQSGLNIIGSNYSSDDSGSNGNKKYSWSDISNAVIITLICCAFVVLAFVLYGRLFKNKETLNNNSYRSIEEQSFTNEYKGYSNA